jgi:hypothetical protein
LAVLRRAAEFRRSYEHVVDADLTALGERAQRLGGGETNKGSDCEELHFDRRVSEWQQAVFLMIADLLYTLQGGNRIEL